MKSIKSISIVLMILCLFIEQTGCNSTMPALVDKSHTLRPSSTALELKEPPVKVIELTAGIPHLLPVAHSKVSAR